MHPCCCFSLRAEDWNIVLFQSVNWPWQIWLILSPKMRYCCLTVLCKRYPEPYLYFPAFFVTRKQAPCEEITADFFPPGYKRDVTTSTWQNHSLLFVGCGKEELMPFTELIVSGTCDSKAETSMSSMVARSRRCSFSAGPHLGSGFNSLRAHCTRHWNVTWL